MGLNEFGTGSVQIYAALSQLAEGNEDAAVRIINDLLDQTRAAPRLVRHGNDPWHLHFTAPGVSAVTGWLAELATAAAMLIGSDDAARLHLCNAERCDNVFHDMTRNRTQRFCSTACQNRTKVAAFRAREGHPSSAG
jgi:predicted RNA-binding Zn ribbon-like protein